MSKRNNDGFMNATFVGCLIGMFVVAATAALVPVVIQALENRNAMSLGYSQKAVQMPDGKVYLVWTLPEATPQPLEVTK